MLLLFRLTWLIAAVSLVASCSSTPPKKVVPPAVVIEGPYQRVLDIAATVLAEDPELGRHPALREALARRLDEAAEAFLAKS